MNKGNVFDELRSLKPRGMNFGTERTRALLDRLGSPDKSLKIIHIAGTNGKGSTAEFMTEILLAAGKRVGTFTSPEVYTYFDQFRIDGKPIGEERLANAFGRAWSAADGAGATAFEIETAGVLAAFEEADCEYAVIECGLGGRYDATNAISKKEVAVITSVSLEHTAVLGDTVAEICAHKTGIIRDCPAVINAFQTEEAKRYFAERGLQPTESPELFDGNLFLYGGKRYALKACGVLQPYNAATAIEAAHILGIDERAIFTGIGRAVPPGRLERIYKDGRVYLLDGAHNPAAFLPLNKLLRQDGIPKDRTILYGSLSDKDMDANLRSLAGLADRIVAVRCDGPRAADLKETVKICRRYFDRVTAAEGVAEALKETETEAVVVCGSFTLLKEAKQWIEKK